MIIATNSVSKMATNRLILNFSRKLTIGLSKMAIMVEKINGTNISLPTYKIKKKLSIPIKMMDSLA